MKNVLREIIKKLLKYYPILLILAVALILRTIFLNEVPLGLSNDELSFIIAAKSVALTGKDISGTWQPWSLQPIYNAFPMSELSFLIATPFLSFFKLTLFIAKLPYALFGTFLVGILYAITKKLFSQKEALTVGLVAAISPWGIMFGRTAFDFPIAICYYMLALAVLLYAKSWKILLAFIPLFLAFYSYIGTKIIFLPFVLLTVFFAWFSQNQKKYTKYYLTLIIACILLFIFFLFSLNSGNAGKRLSEVSTPSSQSIIDKVNFDRRLSVNFILNPLISNKYTVFAKDFLNKYVGIFSPQYQFISGDSDTHLSLWYHGYFYYVDLIFLLLGLYCLFRKNKKASFLLIGLALIAPLPDGFSANSEGYMHRGALIYPVFLIIIGIGIAYLLSLPRKPLLKKLLTVTVIITYIILFVNFLAIYFLRFPIYNSESGNFGTRVLSRYIVLADAQHKFVYVYAGEPDALYRGYLLYANTYTRNSANLATNSFNNATYTIDNVRFLKGCPSQTEINSDKNIIIVSGVTKCGNIKVNKNMKKPVEIVQLADSGTLFFIYKDRVCNNYSLTTYPNNFKFFDFNIEKLSTGAFCSKYIFDKN